MDEDRLQLRCDRGVDGVTFVKERIGEFLKSGIDIAGYHYDFLGYSNSGLKQHTVRPSNKLLAVLIITRCGSSGPS